MGKIRLEHYGVTGEGRTVTEAKRDAGRRIEEMLSGSYQPEIFQNREYAILVHREPFGGWYTTIIADDEGPRAPLGGGCSHATREEACKAARMHLAQLAWTHADGPTAPAILLDEKDRKEFVSWTHFQVEYKRLALSGLSPQNCHFWACQAMDGKPKIGFVVDVEGEMQPKITEAAARETVETYQKQGRTASYAAVI